MPEHLPYVVATGHDVALIDMEEMVQQPSAGMVQPVERLYGVGGAHYDDGAFVVFRFDMIESDTLYQSLLGQFGLNSNDYSNVTIYARNDRLYWRHYNGVAHRPEPGADARWGQFFLRNVEIYVTDLVEIA